MLPLRRRSVRTWSLLDFVRHHATEEERKALDKALAADCVFDLGVYSNRRWTLPELSPPLQALREDVFRVLDAILQRIIDGPQKFRGFGFTVDLSRRIEFDLKALSGKARCIHWPTGILERSVPAICWGPVLWISLMQAPAVEPQKFDLDSMARRATALLHTTISRQRHVARSSDPEQSELDTLDAHVGAAPKPARKRQYRSFAKQDEPYIKEMHRLLRAGQARTPSAAAALVMDGVKLKSGKALPPPQGFGSSDDASVVARLVRRYKDRYPG
jgi:hypothetical protein